MMVSNRNLLFQGSIFRFHVCFGGCSWSKSFPKKNYKTWEWYHLREVVPPPVMCHLLRTTFFFWKKNPLGWTDPRKNMNFFLPLKKNRGAILFTPQHNNIYYNWGICGWVVNEKLIEQRTCFADFIFGTNIGTCRLVPDCHQMSYDVWFSQLNFEQQGFDTSTTLMMYFLVHSRVRYFGSLRKK